VIEVAAITFDFGNTLARVDRAGSRQVIAATALELMDAGIVADRAAFLAAWSEERDRQFREEVPLLREVDVEQRAVRVLARLRGMAVPREAERWDDAAAAPFATADEVALVVDAYSRAFIANVSPVDDAFSTLQRLSADGYRLGILSNWPLALTIDQFAEAQGWLPFLDAIVVSQRVGTIKPHPTIFRAAEAALGMGERPQDILHVGDDWAADVVGARGAGWRVAYLRGRQDDTPLPTSARGDSSGGEQVTTADLEIDELSELAPHLRLAASPAGSARA
jgi:HAD superfamily hydrolase (TIGR01509 family)